MKKCAIIIDTTQGKLIAPVANFSLENCVNALSKVISVDVNKIKQISTSTSYGLYGITEQCPKAIELAINPGGFTANNYAVFEVHYGYIADDFILIQSVHRS